MISFSALTLDLNGELIVNELPTSNIQGLVRRVSKTKTLDGGVWVEDSGYQDADRTVLIEINTDAAIYDRLRYFIENYAQVSLSTRMGFNIAAINNVNDAGGIITVGCELVS